MKLIVKTFELDIGGLIPNQSHKLCFALAITPRSRPTDRAEFDIFKVTKGMLNMIWSL